MNLIVSAAIVVYKGLIPVVGRILTNRCKHTNKHWITTNKNNQLIRRESVGYFHTDKMLILYEHFLPKGTLNPMLKLALAR